MLEMAIALLYMTLTLKQSDLDKKVYIAIDKKVVSLARFLLFVCLFLVRFRFDQLVKCVH